MVGVYVHIPFCVKKCRYCDFNSYDNISYLKESYTKRIIDEINNYTGDTDADTVFFGGGTPTVLGTPLLLKIIGAVNNKFNVKNCEFTVEANPATANLDDLRALRCAGVNRLSLGLQSCSDDELRALGRIHSFSDFLNTYNAAKKAGFDNINIDIMFGIPNQTEKSFSDTLKTVVSLCPQHISCYSLIIEENTPFYNAKLNLPDEETERRMYYTAVDYLEKNGYKQYEISNFAKPGCRCRHNIKYWERDAYIGFGAGACSMIADVRYKNSADVTQYINENKREKEILSKEDALAEHIFLGLRMIGGFNIAKVEKLYGIRFYEKYKNVIDRYVKGGFLEMDDNLRLTKKGVSVSNSIMCEFL